MKLRRTSRRWVMTLVIAALGPTSGGGMPADEDRADELISRAIEAHGGRDRVESLKSLEIEASYRYFTPDMQSHIQDRTLILFPDRLWQLRGVSGAQVVRQLDASGASIDVAGERQHLDASFEKKLRMYLCLRRLELLSFCDGIAFRAAASRVEQGLERVVVELQGEPFADLEIDSATGLLTRMAYDEKLISFEDEGQELSRVEVRYSDFRQIEGLVIAHRVERFTGGQLSSFYTVDSVAIDRAAGLEKPAGSP